MTIDDFISRFSLPHHQVAFVVDDLRGKRLLFTLQAHRIRSFAFMNRGEEIESWRVEFDKRIPYVMIRLRRKDGR